MNKIAFTGSFDPITLGHLWVIEEASNIADNVEIIIATNPNKKYMFPIDVRAKMISDILIEKGLANRASVHIAENEYSALTATELGCEYLIRGIRSASDFDYESVIQKANTEILGGVKTLFVMPPRDLESVSSSFVKSLIGPKRWHIHIQKFVPKVVYRQFVFDYLLNQLILMFGRVESNESFVNFIIDRYSQNSGYHSLDHIISCLQEVNNWSQHKYAWLAILFHDIDGSVTESAKIAKEQLNILGFGTSTKETVCNLIRSTDYFNYNRGFKQSEDEKLIQCVDLSILGKSPTIYNEYVEGVRKEYSHYSDEQFNSGRLEVLQKLQGIDLFPLPEFAKKYEKQARSNIAQEIVKLCNSSVQA